MGGCGGAVLDLLDLVGGPLAALLASVARLACRLPWLVRQCPI
jgi:hypothetical protein